MSSSIPTQDDRSDSGQEESNDCYVIRLTTFERYSFEEAMEILENDLIVSWVMSRELKPQEHFHVVVKAKSGTAKDKIKVIFKDFVYSFWPERARGFGNAQYNFQVCLDESKAISYAIKEKEKYEYSGYTEEFIKERLDESFLKTQNYKAEYTSLCKEFMIEMDDITFKQKLILLRSKYGLKINLMDINAYLLSNKVSKNPEYALFLAKQ